MTIELTELEIKRLFEIGKEEFLKEVLPEVERVVEEIALEDVSELPRIKDNKIVG